MLLTHTHSDPRFLRGLLRFNCRPEANVLTLRVV
jgi:hypothetical protein